MIEFQRLHKSYAVAGREISALQPLDLTIEAGEVFGIIGHSGAGKSTLIRMINRLEEPSGGRLLIGGEDVTALDADGLRALRRRIGYMTQRFSLYEDLSVRENLEFLAAIQDLPRNQARQRVDALLQQYRLQDRQPQLAGTLSGGQKQRLALAGAVVHSPELLFLDEPTSAVDPESRRDFWEALFELADAGTTVLVSTHYMDEAERCHRLTILDRGALVADGTPAELCSRLQGRTLQVTSSQPRQASRVLAELPGVLSVAQIGTHLRVLCNEGAADVAALRRALASADLQAHIEIVAPNLEDVFVAATRGRGREPAA